MIQPLLDASPTLAGDAARALTCDVQRPLRGQGSSDDRKSVRSRFGRLGPANRSVVGPLARSPTKAATDRQRAALRRMRFDDKDRKLRMVKRSSAALTPIRTHLDATGLKAQTSFATPATLFP